MVRHDDTTDDDDDDLDITHAVKKELKPQQAAPSSSRIVNKIPTSDEETLSEDEDDLDAPPKSKPPVFAKPIAPASKNTNKPRVSHSTAIRTSPKNQSKSKKTNGQTARPSSSSSASSDPYAFAPKPVSKRGRKLASQSKTSASQKRQPVIQHIYSSSEDENDDLVFDVDRLYNSQRRKRKAAVAVSPISIKSTDSDAKVISSDEDDGDSPKEKVKTKVEKGKEKIIMTDDEDDDAYLKFRESKKRKTTRGRKPKKDPEKEKAKGKETVTGGVRGFLRPTNSQLKERAVNDEGGYENPDLPDVGIPEYLLKKKARIAADQKKRTKKLEEIYRFPPNFDDMEFDLEDSLADIEEKPDLPGASPSRGYEDITLESSRGVIPASIAQWLRDYQIEGVQFMHKNFMLNTGCILGDDMGLGKTIQVIAFLTVAFGKTGDIRDSRRMRKMRAERPDEWYPRVMIVCPGTLIHNWQRELDTWGWWQVYTYHGSKRSKEEALEAAKMGYLEIMITTYDTYRLDESKINAIEWDCIIADECQKIKERKSGVTQAMNVINSLCRIGLTGTAIQNNYGEIWTLLNWIRPGDLGSHNEWAKDIEGPLKLGQAHGATNAELALGRTTANNLVKNLLPRMFLRRMKSLIAHQLPKKTDKVVFCKLAPLQQDVYEKYLESDVVQFIKTSDDKCDCQSGKTKGKCCHKVMEDETPLRNVVFPCITNIMSLCNHLANWIPTKTDPIEKQEKDMEKLQIGLGDEWEHYYRQTFFDNVIDPDFCGKWAVLKKLLAFWHENEDKVLIFSYSKKLLKMLQLLMNNTHYSISYLDGDMSLDERTAAVDNFNADPSLFAFLISTKAGGVGLNITSANKVVVFDPSWNPAHDLQAQDRAYRIGQRRDVDVFRLVCAGTIEEIVYARQIYKQQQANIGYQASFERRYFTGVMRDSSRRGELFGLKNLFTFHMDNVVLQDIVNKTNVAESKTGVAILNMDSQLDDVSFDDEDKDDPLSQIQAIVGSQDANQTSGGAKLDPIAAILADAGVDYTHENTEVIGTSKFEEHLSRKAVEANEDPKMRAMTAFQEDMVNDVRFKFGNVPMDVRARQFNSLRKAFGYDSNAKFALVVERWKPEQRASALEKFYHSRRRILAARGEMDEKEAPSTAGTNEVITIEDDDDI